MGKTLTQLVQEITRSNQLQDSQATQIANSQTSAADNPKRLVGQYALSTALSKAFNIQAGSPRFSIRTMPALRKRPLPPKEQQNAQTASWSPITVMESGLTIPVVYGTVKFNGNVMAGHLGGAAGGDDPNAQTLAALIAVGKGPIDSFTGVTLNGTQIDYELGTQFGTPDLAHYDCRLGWNSQPPASNYNDVYTHVPVGSPVSDYPVSYGAPVIFTINMNGFEDLWVYVKFPNGLYNQPTSSSDLAYENCEILVEMRKQGQANWTVVSNNDNLASNKRGIFRTYIRVPNGQYGNYFNPLDNAVYEVRVTKETVNKTSSDIKPEGVTLTAENTMVIEYIVAGVRDDFTYPGIAYLELSAVSTALLSGSCNVEMIVKGRKVRVYSDTTNYTLVWSDNPAWVCLDVLTQPVWFNSYSWAGTYWAPSSFTLNREDGIPVSQIDIQSFIDWAAHCDGSVTPPAYDPTDTKRCTFNGVFDTRGSLWDAAQSIAENARAWLVPPSGTTKYRVILDKATAVSQLFNTGNIKTGTLKQTYTSMIDRATEIQADFLNKDNNYNSETLHVVYPGATVFKEDSVDLFGITVPSQAWRRASLFLYYNALTPLEIEFETGQDAINCEVGDVIGVQHELPQWGYGGRVVSATAGAVTLDRPVTIVTSTNYKLLVRSSDDTLTEYPILFANNPATGATYTLNGTFSPVPSQYDPFAFGLDQLTYKPFRVIGKENLSIHDFKLSCQEYNASVYNVDTGAAPIATPNYSSLVSCPSVTLDKLDEILIKKQDGSIIDCIDVYFTRPNNSLYSKADIYYRSKATVGASYGDSWSYAGVTLDEKFRIENVLVNRYYQIAVVTNNTAGQKATIASSPMSEVYTLGKADPPSNVTNFVANQNLNMLTFSWSHIEDADLWGYEIRQGAIYASSTLVIDLQSASRYDWPIPLNGTYRFWLVAIDTSGNKSTTPASLDVTLSGVEDGLNFLYDTDLIYTGGMSGPAGTKFHYTWTSGTPGSGYLGWSVSGASGSGTPPVWLNQFTSNPDFLAYFESSDIQIAGSSVGANIRLAETDDITALNVTDQTFPTRTDQTYPDDTDQHISTITSTYLYYAFSDTTPATGNFTRYTQPVRATFKYIRVRQIALADNYNTQVKVKKLRVCADMDDINMDITVSVADTGTTVTFATYGLTFFAAPQIQATVSYGGSAALTVSVVPVISNLSTTSCIVKLLDIAGAGRAGTVILNVHGY
jgi:predicted phage tail protein